MLFSLSHPHSRLFSGIPSVSNILIPSSYVPKPCESSHLRPELSSPLPRNLCWLPEIILCSSPRTLNLSLDILHQFPCRRSLSFGHGLAVVPSRWQTLWPTFPGKVLESLPMLSAGSEGNQHPKCAFPLGSSPWKQLQWPCRINIAVRGAALDRSQ